MFILITFALWVGASLAIDAAARELAADVKLAMKRADLSLDFVSRCTGVPYTRLSDQLNGKTPFTAFWRFTVQDIRETDFWLEFLELRAQRIDRALVCTQFDLLLTKLDALVGLPPRVSRSPMAKMELSTCQVELPLRGRKAQVG